MEAKYGKLENELKMMPLVCMAQFIVGLCFLIGGVIALRSALVSGGSIVTSIVLFVVGIAFVGYCARLLFHCKIGLYEKAIVVNEMFKTQEIPLENIFAIYWDFPGANSINSRGPNKNVTTAEILLSGGHCAYRITSGIYKDMENVLADYQNAHNIQKDLEIKSNKPGRYNYTLE